MADRRKEFAEKLNKKKKAKDQGLLVEAPDSKEFVDPDQKWMVVSLYGPNGPYANSDHNTFIVHGTYKEHEDAEVAMDKFLNSVNGLKYTQTVVWETGEPLAMPLRPHIGVDRKFSDNQERAQDQWQRMSRAMEAEAQELKQRTLLAKKVYEKEGKGKMGDVTVEAAKDLPKEI